MLLDITRCTLSCGRLKSPLQSARYRPRSWRVSPGRMRAFTAFPSWSHMDSMGFDWSCQGSIRLMLFWMCVIVHEDSASPVSTNSTTTGWRTSCTVPHLSCCWGWPSLCAPPPPPRHDTSSASLPHFFDTGIGARNQLHAGGGGGRWGLLPEFFSQWLARKSICFARIRLAL